MSINLLILICLSQCIVKGFCQNTVPNIAIIGGGASGTSCGYYLRELFGKKAQIHLYEAKEIGGRVATVKFAGQEYESGGSIMHPRNMYAVNLTQMLGLKHRPAAGGKLGIFNGEEMVFTGSSFSLITMAKMLWRYGMDIINLNSWIEELLGHFSRIYSHQAAGQAFTTVEKLLSSLSPEFVDLLSVPIRTRLQHDGFSQRFIDELARGALRTNYGQDVDIQAFVASVSLAGALPGLWSVQGGNKRIFQGLVHASQLKVIHDKVTAVTLDTDHTNGKQYKVSTVVSGTASYDIVVVANPLHDKLSQITFNNFPKKIHNFPGEYQRTVANFVHGTPNITKFGFSTLHDFTTLLLTSNPNLYYNSIGKQMPVNFKGDGEAFMPSVWKVFAEAPLTNEQLNDLFLSYDHFHSVDWAAYPKYRTMEEMPPFQLHDRLYYTSAIEWSASTIETSIISGKNVALLAYNQWMGLNQNIDPDPNEEHIKTEL